MRTFTAQALIKKSEDPGTMDVLSQPLIHCVWSSDLSRGQQQSEGSKAPLHTDYTSCYVAYG